MQWPGLYDCIALHGPQRFLHDWSSAAERLRFELFAMIDGYLIHLDKLGARMPADCYETVTRAQVASEALAARPLPLAPAFAVHVDAIRVAK